MKTRLFLAFSLTFALAAPAGALNVTLFNVDTAGIDAGSFSWSMQFDSNLGMNIVEIHETWLSNDYTFLQFDDMELRHDYLIRKHVFNDSGIDWASFNHELLDPAGQTEDFLDKPIPDFVPTGYSTSNTIDGLSFSEPSNIARTSEHFSDVLLDISTDQRDWIEFYDGLVKHMGTTEERSDVMTFGLHDTGSSENQAFLLAQRANVNVNVTPPAIPEPATLLLVGGGLLGGVLVRRRTS
jgi:hypothetical protein